MPDTSARVLRLLSLLRSRTTWTGPALADELGVSSRTVRRDIGMLRELGYAVDVTRGAGGHYRLGAGALLPPLVFDDDQAVAIAVALQAAPRTISGLADAAARALDTVLPVLPSRLRTQVAALEITSIRNPWDLAAPSVSTAALLAVSAAIRRSETLRYDYTGPDHQPGPARLVQPHHLVVWAGRWYLVGWDPTGGAWRTLRLDRVRTRTPNGPPFEPRTLPEEDIARFVMRQLDRGDTSDHWPCRGTAVIGQPAGLMARWAPGGAVVEAVTEDTTRIWLGAWSWIGLAALLGTFDGAITDPEPGELREACHELARRYARA
ncbi:WYL domain-containing protein [Umezawaea sp. Da 62-37]|uniref:helix-turn-helix transcriptional regulator n=1 Tax=Umezawaea sp. Da 62-37 TaxID=3075927 RepID=UPI0028F6FEE6|nr:WYL domain-containing protein [Umezawaea sp. Da 62-37]WNV88289.1 WYL domain-containing protein [Umezawaea sp. Da 62-37]